jgi:integrase
MGDKFLEAPMGSEARRQARSRIGVLIEALGPEGDPNDVTRDDCRKVVSEVIANLPRRPNDPRPMSLKTQGLYVELLRRLFRWAELEGLVKASPAATVQAPKGKSGKKREGFSSEELTVIFSSPFYKDQRNRKLTPGEWFVPLIALYSGMRLSEIVLLRRPDMIRRDGVDAFRLREREGRTLKTSESLRDVPVHSELERLGLMDYVRGLPADAALWPDLLSAKDPGDAYSKAFIRFLDGLGIEGSGGLHRFRHGFRTACRASGVSREAAHALGGWSLGEEGDNYGDWTLPALGREIAKLTFHADLSHLSPSRAVP